MLEVLKNGNKTVGLKQSMKAVEALKAKQVFIAKDADERVVGRIKELCIENNIPIVYVDTMKQLGKACNIDVGAAVACLL
ncbi:ribosomal L7Ae/L30e/S12e/Gadd45 family protein [Acetivibrio straminisolvens]|uniref:Firmicutes ribosomal L7Ae family protein n=1 Tax=Acetivibrio straminisolvens JCM 21531 TaxID=1294263 RepID=W4V3L4_9FIRM|nr:ribosomal L7Ae/L30e/S12e/Gadd45 family protein [Acetivibrio straminisolvens]GAE87403.1 Firmicutes ribosomal L7Ae family protein [Acetivibrio straminisolvens JCM 21531]